MDGEQHYSLKSVSHAEELNESRGGLPGFSLSLIDRTVSVDVQQHTKENVRFLCLWSWALAVTVCLVHRGDRSTREPTICRPSRGCKPWSVTHRGVTLSRACVRARARWKANSEPVWPSSSKTL